MASLSAGRSARSEGAGEAECERSRGSDPGLRGEASSAPQNSRNFGILLPPQSERGAVRAAVARTSPSMLPSNGSKGRTPGRARPATAGNFPSQTQGDCGTDGIFPLLRSWETKGYYFKILSPFQHVGGPEEAKASPKHWIKTHTDHRRLPRQELLDTTQPQHNYGKGTLGWLWEHPGTKQCGNPQ